jgi:lysophospholipase L1-like esterase
MNPAPAKPRRWKRLLQNLALSSGTFLLCGVIFEIVLRLNGYGNLEIYEPDQKLYWKLKPNQDCFTKVDHKPVRINSHGTRGPEFDPAKAAGTVRILSIGDSRTFGWGLAESETYSARLQQSLAEKYGGGRKVEVINAGVNGWSYSQMAVYFRDVGLAFKPDVVVLGEANPWTQFSERNSPEFVAAFLRRVRLKNFLRRFAIYHYVVEVKLKDVYARQRSKFMPVDPKQDTFFREQQQADPDAVFRGAIADLCGMAQSNGVKVVVLYMPVQEDLATTNQSNLLALKREVCGRLHVPLVDPLEELRTNGNVLYLEADHVHFNTRGNEILGRRLYESVKDLTP